MAHFAQLNDSNIVLAINVIADADCVDGASESEAVGITFCKSLWGADTIWKQTSFNGTIRKQFAVVGGSYDPTRNEFVGLSPWASWVLNATNDWTAPLLMPVVSGKFFAWDESAYQTDNTTGFIETN